MIKQIKKNVIFIVLDSLRYDRLGFSGHSPSPSPILDELLSSGLVFTNCYSTGCPTEFAYPSLTTSTLPLDHGGYGEGIKNREVSIAEIFHKEGYRTGIFFEDYFRSTTKYDRGFNDVFLLYDLNRFMADINDTIPYYANKLKNGEKTFIECTNEMNKYLPVLLTDMIDYCEYMHNSVEDKKLLPSLLLHNYDFNIVLELLLDAELRYAQSKTKFIQALLIGEEKIFIKIKSIILTRQKLKNSNFVDGKIKLLQIKGFIHNLISIVRGKLSPLALKRTIKRLLLKHEKVVGFVSVAYIVNNLLNWIDNIPKDRPFFAWIHTADIHERNFVSYDITNNQRAIDEEVSSCSELFSMIIREGNKYKGNPFYDFAINYTDMQIGKLIDSLKERNLFDNTMIVVTSDHGHDSTGWPVRNNIHIARDFFDELYHIPVAFINKEISASKYEQLASSLDILPTLLSLLGFSTPSSLKGIPIEAGKSAGRDYVIMEHMGPGPCDFQSKPIKICVRSNTLKLLYEFQLSQDQNEGCIKEIFNLLVDPNEEQNIVGNGLMSDDVNILLSVASKRVQEIKDKL